MTDLEGASGVAGRWEDFGPGGRVHEEARRLLTGDVNAAVEGALRGGADEVVVLDGHGDAFSILIEQLHPAAKLIRGRRVLEMRARTHIPPFILVSGRPRLGVFMGSAPRGASPPLRPRALVPTGEVSPAGVPPPGNGAPLTSCPSLL